MNILGIFKKGALPVVDEYGQAVIVSMPLTEGEFGSDLDRKAVEELAERIERVLEEKGEGEYDGHEYGQGQATLYFYGKDAGDLYKMMEPLLKKSALLPVRSVLRYGQPGDPSAQEKVRLVE